MPDYLDILARDAKKTTDAGYYEASSQGTFPAVSLRKAILESKRNAVITEIKAASPSRGTIKTDFDPAEVTRAMETGGATGISVLTEPKHFGGSLGYLRKVREAVSIPILMKDIIIDPIQLEAASRIGANVILLIEALFERRYCRFSLDEMITEAHSKCLEVLLEAHSEEEFEQAIETDCDLVGINNRDLRTLKVDLRITERILNCCESSSKVVVSESGVMTPDDLRFLRRCGAQAFLIGSSVMMADNIEQKVKEFVTAQ
jgi:indole-3-glycerol phosphate synthase